VRVLPPKDESLRIYRSFDYGDLARLLVLDTRQYRSDQECNDVLGPACPGFPDLTKTMLGNAQEAWLFDRLAASPGRWNVLAQQVVFAPTPIGELRNWDQWDGYPAARQRIVDFLQTAAIRNPVVLTGDIHAAGAGWLPSDLVQLTGPALATEWVATGISSTFPASLAQLAKDIIEALPHVDFFDPFGRGYVSHTVSRDEWRADFRVVSTTAQPTATVSTAASFVVEDGNPAPQPA
jgi:alkaline phosphatase D